VEQTGWRWCSKCQGLFFAGGASQGICPADRGAHDGAASGAYTLDDDAPHAGGQSSWRWCGKCQGLFFGGGAGQGTCPADGGGHDGSASGDYTLDFEGAAAPADAQSGWRWCDRCQGLFFAGGAATAGNCPAGGAHSGQASGAYVVKHQPAVLMATAFMNLKLATPEIAFLKYRLIQTPLFSEAASAELKANPHATIRSQDSNEPWCSLAGWLDQPAHAADAVVQIRRTGLTVRLDARADPATQLLPLGDNSPSAVFAYDPAQGGERKQLPLQAVLDVQGRFLKFVRAFAPEGTADAAADRELYAELVDRISSSAAGASLEVSYAHAYRVQKPSTTNGQSGGHRFPPWIVGRGRFRRSRFALDDEIGIARGAASHVAREPDDPTLATLPRGTRDPDLQVSAPLRAVSSDILADLRRTRPDIRRWVVDPEPEPGGDTIADDELAGQFSIGVTRPLDDEATFPDLPRQTHQGWGQVPGRAGKPPLHFRDSDRADTFYYLPTAFKLGFYLEHDAGGAGRPPMRPELYLDSATDAYRVRVTLVALPFIDDEDREALRAHLQDVVLLRTLPYVGLELRAGLEAEFVADFASGSAEDGQRMPAGIRFTVTEKQPEDRLVLEFDMEAFDYAIFCELLLRGLFGRVTVHETGVQESLPVRLRLDDMVSNALTVQLEGLEAAAATEGAGPDSAPQLRISISNPLAHAVRLSSLQVDLVDRGALAGIVFDAERIDLLPQGQPLAAKPEPTAAATLPFTPKLVSAWDETVVVPGVIGVEPEAPADWLNRVNRDPSLQRHQFRVQVLPSIPAAGADRIQLINLRVLKAGDAATREERQLLPSADPTDLVVHLTLAELAGSAGEPPVLSLEYDALYTNGKLSLPQRVALDPGVSNVVLPIVVETPTSRYTVSHDGTQEETDRAGAVALIDRLRADGKRWNVYASEPAPEPDPTGPDGPSGPTDPGQPAQGVNVVTDLLAGPFGDGRLLKVFVELQPDSDTAPTSTLVFDPQHATSTTWRPESGSIPPFRYRVTYLYPGNKTMASEGTETELVLLLDAPPAP